MRPYSRLMYYLDFVRHQWEFYTWAVNEVFAMWPNNPGRHLDVFRGEPSEKAALRKLENTLGEHYRFCVVQLAASFETFLADLYCEILERETARGQSGIKIALTDEYRLQLPEFENNEIRAFLRQEWDRFARIHGWMSKLREIEKLVPFGSTLQEYLNEDTRNLHSDELNDQQLVELTFFMRNLIVHRAGIINDRDLEKHPHLRRYVIHGELDISKDFLDDARTAILEVCDRLADL